MSYKIKDEFMDLAAGRHVVIFHNADTGHEHHLINHFNVKACPTCGLPKPGANGELVDFAQIKADTLAALEAHHKQVMDYRSKHAHVRIRSKPA